MKTARTILTALVFTVMIASAAFSADKRKTAVIEVPDATIESLLNGLKTDNLGLKASSAQLLGELKIDKAVIPLMGILHSDKSEDARIAAALALYRIEDARGVFAVKQAIRFDESPRVRKLCSKFYNELASREQTEEEINVAVK